MRTYMMIVVAALGAAGCDKGKAERAQIKKAVDAFCGCVEKALTMPPAEVAKASCKQEEDAYNKVWSAYSGRGDDDDAQAMGNMYDKCWSTLSEAREIGRKAGGG